MEIFCLEGSVAAGKSTIFRKLRDRYGDKVIFLEEPIFEQIKLNETSYNPLKQLYSSNLRPDTYLSAQLIICQELFKYYKTIDFTKSNIIVMDRCLESCSLFHTIGYLQGLLSPFSRDFLKTFTLDYERSFKHLLGSHNMHKYFVDTPVMKCVEQIKTRGRECELFRPIDFWINFTKEFRKAALSQQTFEMIASGHIIERDISQKIDRLILDQSQQRWELSQVDNTRRAASLPPN